MNTWEVMWLYRSGERKWIRQTDENKKLPPGTVLSMYWNPENDNHYAAIGICYPGYEPFPHRRLVMTGTGEECMAALPAVQQMILSGGHTWVGRCLG